MDGFDIKAEASTSLMTLDDVTQAHFQDDEAEQTGDSTNSGGANNASAAKRMKSCAPCRLRRVKCERPPGKTDCNACTLRNLPCTPMPKKQRVKVISREGKRIQQARQIFGDLESNKVAGHTGSSSIASSSAGEVSTTETESGRLTALIASLSEKQEAGALLSPSGTQARLSASEIQGSLTANLLEVYCRDAPPIALLEEINLKKAFERAGRRITMLNDQYQVLCKTVIALGARTSDHPLLIGTSAPRISELGALAKYGKDLREYGARRENACRMLLDDALKTADEKGTLRTATPEAVTSLLILEGLLDTTANEEWLIRRPYSNAYNGHAKELLDQEQRRRETGAKPNANSSIGDVARWTAFVRDALSSAYTGQTPRFSEDDIFILLQGNDFGEPVLDVVRKGEMANKIDSFWHLFGTFMLHLCTLARETPARLTGPKARAAPLDIDFATHFIQQVTIAEETMPHLLERASLLAKHFDDIGVGNRYELRAMHTLVRNFRINMYYMYLLLAKCVRDRVDAQSETGKERTMIYEVDLESPGRFAPVDETSTYWSRLLLLQAEVRKKAFYGIRGIVKVLEETIEEDLPIGMVEWLDIRGIQILFSRLPLWTRLLVDMPVLEAGGPFPDWTYEAKIKELGTILQALHAVGWQSETLARPADWVHDEIRSLKAQQHEYWLRQAQQAASASGSVAIGGGFNSINPPHLFPQASPSAPASLMDVYNQNLLSVSQNAWGQPSNPVPAPEQDQCVWSDAEIQSFLQSASTGQEAQDSSGFIDPNFQWALP